MKKNIIKNILALSSISLMFVQVLYFIVEPTTAIALTTDDVIVTLNVDAGVAISDGAAATMTPNIGVTSSRSVGSSSWIVTSNSATGYTLAVKASTAPALKKPAVPGAADEFADYTPVVPTTPDAWGGVTALIKEFGFSARGTDALASFGTATTCGNTGTGVPDASANFLGFDTSDKTIATRTAITTPTGVQTFICFAAEQGSGVYATAGVYTATITATVAVI
jgi:hypothetical protein